MSSPSFLQLVNSVHTDESRVIIKCSGSPLKKDFLFKHSYHDGDASVVTFETGPEHKNVRITLKTFPILRSEYYGKDNEFFAFLKVRKWLAGF